MTGAPLIPDRIARLMTPAQRHEFGALLPDERQAQADARLESDLQSLCEKELLRRGYRRRVPDEIRRPGPLRGWFIHLHKTKQNPLLLDLLILRPDGRFIEVELKTLHGKPSPEQQALIDRGGRLCRTFDDFRGILAGFEHGTP